MGSGVGFGVGFELGWTLDKSPLTPTLTPTYPYPNPRYYCIYFVIIWFFWDRAANYSTRFGDNTLPNMVYFAIMMGGIVVMTLNIFGGPGIK